MLLSFCENVTRGRDTKGREDSDDEVAESFYRTVLMMGILYSPVLIVRPYSNIPTQEKDSFADLSLYLFADSTLQAHPI